MLLSSTKLNGGHANFSLIVITAFNCFAKNELKRSNAPERDEPPEMNRKIRKLQNCSTGIAST